MTVELLKKQVTYKDKEGEEKNATNFYVRCGSTLIPIEVKYFPDEDNKDKGYAPRKAVLSSFADDLPEKSEENKKK